MKPAIHDASAREHAGGPSLVPDRGSSRNNRARKPDPSDTEAEIAGLLDRSTQELRLAWRQLHRTEPPLGISRDLLIRSLAYDLQLRAHGGPNFRLRRRLQTLAAASEGGARSVDPGVVLKAGSTLVREWRGHTHTVLVRENGLEYERALPLPDGDCRADNRDALVRPAVFWCDQASARFAPGGGEPLMKPAATRRGGAVRCAIYTRKSSEEGLEQEFNSLQAQRYAALGSVRLLKVELEARGIKSKSWTTASGRRVATSHSRAARST